MGLHGLLQGHLRLYNMNFNMRSSTGMCSVVTEVTSHVTSGAYLLVLLLRCTAPHQALFAFPRIATFVPTQNWLPVSSPLTSESNHRRHFMDYSLQASAKQGQLVQFSVDAIWRVICYSPVFINLFTYFLFVRYLYLYIFLCLSLFNSSVFIFICAYFKLLSLF
jgi:hypothetical protein